MGGCVGMFVLDFFSKQIPRATTAGGLSRFHSASAFVFSVAPGIQVGVRVTRREGETSAGKLGSLTHSQDQTVHLSLLLVYVFLS